MATNNYFFSDYTHSDDELVTTIYEFKQIRGYMPTIEELKDITNMPLKRLMRRLNNLQKRGKVVLYRQKRLPDIYTRVNV